MQEEKSIQLFKAKLPQMLGELTHSNQFLKLFSLSALMITLLCLFIIFFMGIRDPLVITIDTKAKLLDKIDSPKAEDQIKEGIKNYLEKRYQWNPDNVNQRLKDSENFISPNVLKIFQLAAKGVTLFSTEKKVSQRIYPEQIDIDLSKQLAQITGDRVTTIQGLKAAGNLKLKLEFESGPRTKDNPWGVYISSENEE